MGLRSARFSGDPILEKCATGDFRMREPFDHLSVARVQEALGTLGYAPGAYDGVFGPSTGAAVKAYKRAKGLSPADAVVGMGTSQALDADFFNDPPYADAWFGEAAPYVAKHTVDPFIGFELKALLACPLRTVRLDMARATIDNLDSGFLVCLVAQSRASQLTDVRLSDDDLDTLANPWGSATAVPIRSPDGAIAAVAVGVRDTLLMGRRFYTRDDGWRMKVPLRDTICHEVTHVRNYYKDLEATTADDDDTIYYDTALAARMTATTFQTAQTFSHFVQEIVASHIGWLAQEEDEGNLFAARFLDARALAEALRYFFVGTDRSWFNDNGYIEAIAGMGDHAIYRQSAMWLRAAAGLIFADDQELDNVSTELFQAAADAADELADDAGAIHVAPDGLNPLPQDFTYPPEEDE